jgi:hypothetical protein
VASLASILCFDQGKDYVAEMSKTESPISRSARDGGVMQTRRDAACQYIGNQEHSKNWKPLLASVPVRFMDLRTGMCRWPIGNPHHLETFRFCGCACSSAAVYCETHRKLALTSNQARAPASRKYLPPSATRAA